MVTSKQLKHQDSVEAMLSLARHNMPNNQFVLGLCKSHQTFGSLTTKQEYALRRIYRRLQFAQGKGS
jgi:hypothetical protein